MLTPERRIIRRDAPIHVRAAVHSILTGHMAGHLVQHQIDLTDRTAARTALEVAGFGEPSIVNLLDRSIALAKHSVSHLERSDG